MIRVIFAIAFLVLTGCASLHEKANEAYSKGEYRAAAAFYTEILKRTPNDPIALERIQQAHQQLIQGRLLEVRQQRLSDNFQDALDKLASIQQDEASWKVAPQGPAFATQSDETEALFRFMNNEARDEIAQGKFLKAKMFSDKYASVFNAGSTRRKEEILLQDIVQQGSRHCDQMKKLSNALYAREFLNRYCMVWGKADSQKDSHPSTAEKRRETYGSVKIVGGVESLPAEALSTLTGSIFDSLKASPFYDATSKPLEVKVAGRFNKTYNETPSVKVHSYQVSVPYQVIVSESYEVQIPDTTYITQCNYGSGSTANCYQQPLTTYHSETRHRDVAETRYKDETRTQLYPATDYTLDLHVMGTYGFTLDNVNYGEPLDSQLETSGSFSETQNSAIGLEPKPKNVPNEITWLQTGFALIGPKLKGQIAHTWDAKYCQVPSNLLEKTQIETVMKCLKGSKKPHDFVDNWFQTKFGLDYNAVRTAIGFES